MAAAKASETAAGTAAQTGPMIHRLIAGVMGEMSAVGKNKEFKSERGGNFRYRGIEDVVNALKGPLENAGLYYVPRVLKRERYAHQSRNGGTAFYTFLEVEFTIYAPDGSSVSGSAPGEGMDYGDKSTNKAMSAAQKYFLCQTFHLATADMAEPEDEDHADNGLDGGRPMNDAGPGPAPEGYIDDPPYGDQPADNGAAERDPLEDNGTFMGALEKALKSRGFRLGAGTDAAFAAICNRNEVPSLGKLGLKSRHQAIEAIQAGKLDKYKSPARPPTGTAATARGRR